MDAIASIVLNMSRRRRLIVAALHAHDGEIGRTHLYALLARFEHRRLVEPVFHYRTGVRGLPWSGEVRDEVGALVSDGLVECRDEGRARLHTLTVTGTACGALIMATMQERQRRVAGHLRRDALWVRNREYTDALVDWTPRARTSLTRA